jgi:large subunit ribosomal protein L23
VASLSAALNHLRNEQLLSLLIAPQISEKTARLMENGQVVFYVRPHATKAGIKKAIELAFHVKVDCVNVSCMPGKKKVFRGTWGRRVAHKKAYIKLCEGERIEGLSE